MLSIVPKIEEKKNFMEENRKQAAATLLGLKLLLQHQHR